MPVTHTSPSPWAAWASPQLNQSALDLDRQVERRALHELSRVHVPPEASGRHDRHLLRARGTDAHRPEERLDRDRDVVAQIRELAVREVEDADVGIREVVGQQAEAGDDDGVAPAARLHLEDLDRQRVARLGSFDEHRSRQRVDAIPIERGDGLGGRVRRDLVVAHVTRLVDDRVAALDREHRLVLDVPGEVDAVGRKLVGRGHRRGEVYERGSSSAATSAATSCFSTIS